MNVKAQASCHHTPNRQGIIDRWFRHFVCKRLKQLRHGQLRITDPYGKFILGELEPNSGSDLCVDITINEPRFYRTLALGGSIAITNAYIQKGWECSDLSALLRLMVRNIDRVDGIEKGAAALANRLALWTHRRRANNRRGSRRNILAHYDLGNEFFALFLDSSLTYSCALFTDEQMSLEQASIAKLDSICRKLDLSAEHHVLEIGGGWGQFCPTRCHPLRMSGNDNHYFRCAIHPS